VLGAAGGVGLAAVELGKRMGARVIACASSDDKLAFARAHGADEVVNYAKQDPQGCPQSGSAASTASTSSTIRSAGPTSEAALRAIAWEGRHLVVGFASGEIPKLPLNLTLLKGCSVLGVYWGAWVQQNPKSYRASLEQLARWCVEDKLSCTSTPPTRSPR